MYGCTIAHRQDSQSILWFCKVQFWDPCHFHYSSMAYHQFWTPQQKYTSWRMTVWFIDPSRPYNKRPECNTELGHSWGIRFKAKKCNIMIIPNKDPLTNFYQHDNTTLQQVDIAAYLGILILKSLKLSEHICTTTTKCMRCLGFPWRNLKQGLKEIWKTAYLSLHGMHMVLFQA